MDSSSESTSASASTQRHRKMPGNLALCRTSSEETAARSECLGWLDLDSDAAANHIASSSQPPFIPAVTKSLETETETEHPLNWRYEDGLLRSVGRDGSATDLCLGPAPGIASLVTNALQPYELVLQDCPGVAHHSGTENIFSHGDAPPLLPEPADTASSTTTRTATAASWQGQPPQEQLYPPEPVPELPARHMRFLVGGDGRIRSLAPVYDPNHSTDLVAEQPFCVTASQTPNHQGEGHSSRAYLIPCFDHPDETHIYNTDSSSSERIFQGQQQLFEPDSMASFRSFLLDWRTRDDTQVQLAYQIGFNGSLSPHTGKACDQYDAFQLEVTSEQKHENDAPAVLEIPVSYGRHSPDRSGVRTISPSTLGVAGGQLLQASLVGSAKGGLQTGVLAATSFVVSPDAASAATHSDKPSALPEHWPWAHMLFWGFMVTYAILVKAHSVFRPHHKDHNWKTRLRESNITVDTTAATVASAAAQRQLHLHNASTRCIVGRGRRSTASQRQRQLQRQLQRELFEWDDDVPRIDGTQTTVISMEDLRDGTTTDYSETKLDETLSCSDIEENHDDPKDGDDDDNSGHRYEEYDDDDIESQ